MGPGQFAAPRVSSLAVHRPGRLSISEVGRTRCLKSAALDVHKGIGDRNGLATDASSEQESPASVLALNPLADTVLPCRDVQVVVVDYHCRRADQVRFEEVLEGAAAQV